MGKGRNSCICCGMHCTSLSKPDVTTAQATTLSSSKSTLLPPKAVPLRMKVFEHTFVDLSHAWPCDADFAQFYQWCSYCQRVPVVLPQSMWSENELRIQLTGCKWLSVHSTPPAYVRVSHTQRSIALNGICRIFMIEHPKNCRSEARGP
jgi:hypothetical protein